VIRNHSDHVALAQKDARLTALEAENERWNEKYAALHARFAQQQTKLEQAEAELEQALNMLVIEGLDAMFIEGIGWTLGRTGALTIPAGAKDRLREMLKEAK